MKLLILLFSVYFIKNDFSLFNINLNDMFTIIDLTRIKLTYISDIFNINYKTFVRNYKKWKNNSKIIINNNKGGNNKIFDINREKQLYKIIEEKIDNNELIDNDIIKILAEEFYINNNLGNKKPSFSNGWINNFKKKYNLISKGYKIYKENTISSEELEKFYKQCKIIEEKYDKKYIFNMDETFNLLVTNFSKLVSKKGKKRFLKYKGNNKEGYTSIYTISASGIMLRPIIILRGKTKKVLQKIKSIDNDRVNKKYSYSGWITEHIMKSVLDEINKFTKNNKSVLILDNYKTHKVDSILEYANKLNIKMFFLPPNMTYKLQPLDVKINGIIKAMIKKINKMNLVKKIYVKNTFLTSINTLIETIDKVSEINIKKSFKLALKFSY